MSELFKYRCCPLFHLLPASRWISSASTFPCEGQKTKQELRVMKDRQGGEGLSTDQSEVRLCRGGTVKREGKRSCNIFFFCLFCQTLAQRCINTHKHINIQNCWFNGIIQSSSLGTDSCKNHSYNCRTALKESVPFINSFTYFFQ